VIRAIRLELVKPIGEPWEEVGPLLRTLAKATPKLLNAAMDARIAIEVAGRDAVKAKIAPEAKAASGDGLAYQAVLRASERLREWGAKKKHPFAKLEVPGAMASAISRAASQAYARRDQERAHFASERVLVRGDGVALAKDPRGIVLSLKLRPRGAVRFAVAHSWGAHRKTLDGIVSGAIPHGDCKLQWDERRRKWYGLLSYEPPAPAPVSVDPARALVVHRGIRNALFLLTSTGQSKPLPGGKFMWQRRGLQARMRDSKRVSVEEIGSGAKGASSGSAATRESPRSSSRRGRGRSTTDSRSAYGTARAKTRKSGRSICVCRRCRVRAKARRGGGRALPRSCG
jgi:hypothetical protein